MGVIMYLCLISVLCAFGLTLASQDLKTHYKISPDGVINLVKVLRPPIPGHCKSTGNRCIRDCKGRKDGDYQSCNGCDVYASCVGGLMYDNRPCAAGGVVWDDNKKRCEWNSTTCKGCYTPGVPCRGTGPRCIKDCHGKPDGYYQSCLGCHIYATCSNGHMYDKRPCGPAGTVWDDNKKLCDWYTNTCFKC